MSKPHSKSELRFSIFGLASAAASSFSLFSLTQSVLSFGVGAVLSDLLTYYRVLGDWVFGSIGAWFGVVLPVWLIDLFILSGLASAAFIRAADGKWQNDRQREEAGQPAPSRFSKVLVDLFRWVVFTLTFVGLVNLILSVFVTVSSMFGKFDKSRGTDETIFRGQFLHFLVIVGGLCVFFAINAYGPQT